MPDTYNPENSAKLKHLASLAAKTSTALAALDTKYTGAFRSLSVVGNSVKFFTSTDASGTAVATFDWPEEVFLDQSVTSLVDNFTWSAATYPNSTNPNLDGKTVLVLGVKGDKETNPTVKYSFVSLEKLIDVYTAGDNSININGYTVTVKISSTAGNLLELKADGLYVGSDPTKLDKVTGAVLGNIATFGASGIVVDSGVGINDVDVSGKMDKVTTAVSGNFAIFGASGAVVDSGVTFATDAEVNAMLEIYFPSGGSSNAGNGG